MMRLVASRKKRDVQLTDWPSWCGALCRLCTLTVFVLITYLHVNQEHEDDDDGLQAVVVDVHPLATGGGDGTIHQFGVLRDATPAKPATMQSPPTENGTGNAAIDGADGNTFEDFAEKRPKA